MMNYYTGLEKLAKKCQNIALSNAHIPKLATYFCCSFTFLSNLGNMQNERSICAESKLTKSYLFTFFPPKM